MTVPPEPPAALTWPTLGYGTLPLLRILVVQTSGLRHVLDGAPVFASLRRAFPHAWIATLVRPSAGELLQGSPQLNEVLVYDRRGTHRSLVSRLAFIAELKERGFDWALVLHASGWVAFTLWQAAVKWRTCVWSGGPDQRPRWAWTYHQQIRQERRDPLALLRELQIEPDESSPLLQFRPDEREWARAWLAAAGWDGTRPVALLPAGRDPDYSAVGDFLTERGWHVATLGRLRLRPLAALVGEARLLVSAVPAHAHLARTLGVPTLTLGERSPGSALEAVDRLVLDSTRPFPSPD